MAAPANPLAEAYARHRQGRLDEAERGYRAVLKANANDPDANYLLGMLYLDRDRPDKAASHFDKAIRAIGRTSRPVDPAWRLALGTALQRAGKLLPALAAFDAALKHAPGNIDAIFCRATALQDLARMEEAATAYESVLAAAPKHADAANNLGIVRRETGNSKAAVAAFQRAVASRPNFTEALCNLGNALADAGRAVEAVPALLAGADARPDDEDLQLALFDCLVQADRADEVEMRARDFLKRRPGSAPVMAALGGALEFLGRKDEATGIFARAIDIDPACSRAHQGLADIKGEAGKSSHIEAIRRILDRAGPDETGTPGLWFALARHHGAAGDHQASFDAFLNANRAKRIGWARRGYGYDRNAMERSVDRLIAAFPSGSLDGAGSVKSDKPVFILGMPRSGTTLTEQILASHPMVHGAGELGLMGQIAARMARMAGYPGGTVTHDILAGAARFYIDSLAKIGGDAARVTDKMPANFMHIGLISLLFDDVRIIHCRRDAMDTCLSCFMQNFRAANLAWTCDLGDLAHYYCQYRRIMDHWRNVLSDGRMLEVDYEDTVADLEGQARRIVAHAGLPWDDVCLDFHKAKRSVVTASYSQVRRKIYSTSIGRWKRYGEAVTPLARGLEACGCGPEKV